MTKGFAALAAAFIGALVLALLASSTPRPLPITASPTLFSAARAMADIRVIARAPHPTGSAESAKVRSFLLSRMRQLGMAVETQAAPLPARAAQRLSKWGDGEASGKSLVNLIGVLPGRDPLKPALLVMAHHDSVWASPGAADDAAGVAAALEIVRAISAQATPERDVVVLFTDAEELGLDGAKLFFSSHPIAPRIGAVINMEARGGGGRVSMFETGRGNEQWVDVYRRSVSRPFSNSLGVLIYELMPNNTDFTIPKKLGLPGFNFAFIGRPELYHSPKSTPEAIDLGSVQDLGDQALAVARTLAFSADLPIAGGDAVFGDLLGLFVIAYSPAGGWFILLISAGLLGFAFARVRKLEPLGMRALGGGVALFFALPLHTVLLLRVLNLVSGSGGTTNYYDRLAEIPRLEMVAFLVCLAAVVVAGIAARPLGRFSAAAPALVLSLIAMLFGGWSVVVLGLGITAGVAAILLPRDQAGIWTGWVGIFVGSILLALLVQIVAPTAGPVLHWPLLLSAVGIAFVSWRDPAVERSSTLLLLVLLAAIGLGQILYLAHFTFLGVGAGTPEVMAAYALLSAVLMWPLIRRAATPRWTSISAVVFILVATIVALTVRLDPIADTVPPYSESR